MRSYSCWKINTSLKECECPSKNNLWSFFDPERAVQLEQFLFFPFSHNNVRKSLQSWLLSRSHCRNLINLLSENKVVFGLIGIEKLRKKETFFSKDFLRDGPGIADIIFYPFQRNLGLQKCSKRVWVPVWICDGSVPEKIRWKWMSRYSDYQRNGRQRRYRPRWCS